MLPNFDGNYVLWLEQPPKCFLAPGTDIVRLFPDFARREEEYFAKTGIFPIMHLIGIRRDLALSHPWVALNLYNAFVKARDLAMADLATVQALKISLPWVNLEYQRTLALLGRDYWAYGIAANRHAIEALTRCSVAQRITSRALTIEELFFRTTLLT